MFILKIVYALFFSHFHTGLFLGKWEAFHRVIKHIHQVHFSFSKSAAHCDCVIVLFSYREWYRVFLGSEAPVPVETVGRLMSCQWSWYLLVPAFISCPYMAEVNRSASGWEPSHPSACISRQRSDGWPLLTLSSTDLCPMGVKPMLWLQCTGT